jgi:UDP-2,3-diacylglucosamine pyrophosphatase LpxH
MFCMRFAVISDGHLFQSYIKNYDAISDLRFVLERIKEEQNPDALLVLGDMFDFKKTPGVFLRHFEGEGLMMPIRDILRDFALPIFCLKGNHEKEEVLRSLDQTVENFHYIKNDWKNFDDVSIYFMDTHFEGDFYEPEVVSQIIQQIPQNPKESETKLLLCHETFQPFPNCIPKDVILDQKRSFEWILNGHMHFWCEKAYGLSCVVTLPALLPSKVVRGKYWTEKYSWQSKENRAFLEKSESPYGYAILDTKKKLLEFFSVSPSKKIVEVSIETTNLTLNEVIDRFRKMMAEISARNDKDSLLILPEIYGDASFITIFVKDVLKEYNQLKLEDLRINTTVKIVTASGKAIAPPLLTPEQLFTTIETELPEIKKKLLADSEMDIEIAILKRIMNDFRNQGLLDRIPPRITTRLETILETTVLQLEDIVKPETYEDDLRSITKRVKE